LIRLVCLALVAAVLSACASVRPSSVSSDAGPEEQLSPAAELTQVPFFPQDIHECGPAALATALSASGVRVTPDELVPKVYIPGRRGSLQAELIATARQYERLPYVIDGSLAAIAREVRAGRPVLVLQNLGLRLFPRWHYAVVVGVTDRHVILRSGTAERMVTRMRTFARTWVYAGEWAIVLLKPGELPEAPNVDRWIQANASFEATGHRAAAFQNYEIASKTWPNRAIVWLALGNAQYTAGNREAAESSFQRAIDVDDRNAAALNNLAQMLAERGCPHRANEYLQRAKNVAKPEFSAAIESTGKAIAPLVESTMSDPRSCQTPE
jgi:tetratricopeptide (TPR) repeat protein